MQHQFKLDRNVTQYTPYQQWHFQDESGRSAQTKPRNPLVPFFNSLLTRDINEICQHFHEHTTVGIHTKHNLHASGFYTSDHFQRLYNLLFTNAYVNEYNIHDRRSSAADAEFVSVIINVASRDAPQFIDLHVNFFIRWMWQEEKPILTLLEVWPSEESWGQIFPERPAPYPGGCSAYHTR